MRFLTFLVVFLSFQSLSAQPSNPNSIPIQFAGIQFRKAEGQDANFFALRELVKIDEENETITLDHQTDFENSWHNLAAYDYRPRWTYGNEAANEAPEIEAGSLDEFIYLLKINWWRILDLAATQEEPEAVKLLSVFEMETYEFANERNKHRWVTSFVYIGKDEEGNFWVKPVKLSEPVRRAILDPSHRIQTFAEEAGPTDIMNLSYTYATEMIERGSAGIRD